MAAAVAAAAAAAAAAANSSVNGSVVGASGGGATGEAGGGKSEKGKEAALNPALARLKPQLQKTPSIKVQGLVSWQDGNGAGAEGGGSFAAGQANGHGEGMLGHGENGEGGQQMGGTFVDEDGNEYAEAKMNMAELTLTFQKHLSALVASEKKKKSDSLRLILRSEFIPTILSWLTSPDRWVGWWMTQVGG